MKVRSERALKRQWLCWDNLGGVQYQGGLCLGNKPQLMIRKHKLALMCYILAKLCRFPRRTLNLGIYLTFLYIGGPKPLTIFPCLILKTCILFSGPSEHPIPPPTTAVLSGLSGIKCNSKVTLNALLCSFLNHDRAKNLNLYVRKLKEPLQDIFLLTPFPYCVIHFIALNFYAH